MNRIHSLGFELTAKLSKNKETGQMRLMPFALMSILIQTDTDPKVVIVEARESELRKLAEDLMFAADELKDRVDPLCELDPMDQIGVESAKAEVRSIIEEQAEGEDVSDPIKTLARAGWHFGDLRKAIEAETVPCDCAEPHPPDTTGQA